MKAILKNANIYIDNKFIKSDMCVSDKDISFNSYPQDFKHYDFSGLFIFPGFSDVHVHLREPGFFYKETIKSGTLAAAHGGYTAICSMPNLKPVPDSEDALNLQIDIIKKTASIPVFPYASITKEEKGEKLSDFLKLHKNAIAFSDDGKGVQDANIMRLAMLKAKKYNKIIAAHCEVNSLLNGGYIHDGEYARLHNHKGISSESEWKHIERDLQLAKETGCKYHVCHVSAKESVDLIRSAKKSGIDVTCETAPHYLVFSDKDLKEDGCFKMNPPIRSEKDKEALINGILDGTIDMIATDHAPHSCAEKSGGLKDSLMGVVGLETTFPALYTYLVKTGIIPLKKLIELMAVNPAKRFSLPYGYEHGNFTVFDLESFNTINPEKFLSMGKSTPFAGKKLFGKCILTMARGKISYTNISLI